MRAILLALLLLPLVAGAEPTLELEASHDRAAAGQTVYLSWSTTERASISRCARTLEPEGLAPSSRSVAKVGTNAPITMPDAPATIVALECWYTVDGQEVSAIETVRVELVTAAELAAAAEAPECWPAPIGKGSEAYGRHYTAESGASAACALWFCGARPRSFCWEWPKVDLAGWTLEDAGLDARWTSTAWQHPSKAEKQITLELYQAHRPIYRVSPSGTYATRPVYVLNAAGARVIGSGMRVAVGAECNGLERLGTSSYYGVAGEVNALRPPEVLPAGTYSVCAVVSQ